MAGKIKGITIEIAGDTQKLNKALEDVNKKGRDLQSELRQVERLLKLDPKNTELLAQKQKLLADAVENSRGKLDRLRVAQEQVNEQFRKGEINEEQYRAFQREVVKAEQDLAKFEKQLRETGLTAEQVGQKLKDAGQKMTDIGKDLSMKVTAPIAAAGAAAFKMAADLNDALGATEQIFGKAAESVKTWADNLDEYYGIAEGDALEYANMMGSLLQNIGGLTEEEAAKQAQALVQLAGDLTAMFGGTTADAVRALTGALKGNNSMLDNYGIAANEAMIKTKAMEMGLVKEGEQLSLAAKQAATLALIMEQTGAAQGQAAREAEGASGSMRAFTTALKNLGTDIGETLLPVITPLIQKLSDIVKAFGELSPATQKTILVVAGLAAAIGPLLVVFGQLATAISSIIGLFGGGAAAGAAAGGAAAAGGGGLAAVFSAITGPIGVAIGAIAALAAAAYLIYDNWEPIKKFFTDLWNSISAFLSKTWQSISDTMSNAFKKMLDIIRPILDGYKTFFSGIWEAIKNIFAGALLLIIDLVTGDFENLKKDAEVIWNNLKNAFARIWDGIKQVFSEALNVLKSSFSSAWNAIKAVAETIWTSIRNGIQSAIDWIRNLPSQMVTLGKNIIQGLVDGIKSMIGKVGEAVKSVADKVTGGLRDVLGIRSPSRVLMQLGEYTGEGFVRGLENTISAVRREAAEMAAAVTGAFGNTSTPGTSIAAGGAVAGGTINMDGLFNGANIIIRNDDDIRKLAQEIWSMAQQAQRSLGGARA